MKNLFLLAIFLSFYLGSFGQVVVVGHVFAEVIEDISVAEQNTLNFGKFSISEHGGTLSVSPEGVISSTGGITISPGFSSPATFRLTGQHDASVSVTLPDSRVTLSNGRNTCMKISRWTLGNKTGKIKLSESATFITIGATLEIEENESVPAGIFYGTYSVMFNYN